MSQKSPITFPLPTADRCCPRDGCTLPQANGPVGARYRQVAPTVHGSGTGGAHLGPRPLGTMPSMDAASSGSASVVDTGSVPPTRARSRRPTPAAAIAAPGRATADRPASDAGPTTTGPARPGSTTPRAPPSVAPPPWPSPPPPAWCWWSSVVLRFWTTLGPVARRGPDRQHRPAAPPRDPLLPATGRRAAALLRAAPLLDGLVRHLGRGRPVAVRRVRRGHPPAGLAGRPAARRDDGWLGRPAAGGHLAVRHPLRHRDPDVLVGGPADRARLPGPRPVAAPAPARAT